MELSYNTCYRNGINGVVFHRTNRGTINQNIIYNNGVVPTLEPEEVVEDWHAGASGKPRQPYSGLVLNNAESVKLWSNRVAARYESDFAFTQIIDGGGSPSPLLAGGNNKVCRGLVNINPDSAVKFVSDETICGIVPVTNFPSIFPTTRPSHYPTTEHSLYPSTRESYHPSIEPSLYPTTLYAKLFINDVRIKIKTNKKATKWQPILTLTIKEHDNNQNVGGAKIILAWNATILTNGQPKSGTVVKTTSTKSKTFGTAKMKLQAFKITGNQAINRIDVGIESVIMENAEEYVYASKLNTVLEEGGNCPVFSSECPLLSVINQIQD